MAFPIYIQADTADFDSPLDFRRSETPSFWSGTDIEFKIAVYEFGSIKSVSKFKSLTLEIKAMGAKGARPLPGASALMSKTITNLYKDLTATEWSAFTNCHGEIEFTAAETAIPAGTHWLVISAIATIDGDEQSLTLAAGEITVQQDGHGTVGEVVVSDGSAYTKAASDERFARLVAEEGVYVDPVGGLDTTGARGRADLPFATLAAAIAAATACGTVYIAPGNYAAATVNKSVSLRFAPGTKFLAPLVIEADGVRMAGGADVDAAASYIATATSAHSIAIDGILAVGKPFGANLTPKGGILVDSATGTFAHPGLTSADLVTTPVVTESGTSRTLALADADSLIRCTNAGAVTITVPASSVADFPVGTSILIRQSGAGQVTLAPATGVTLNTSRTLKTRAQHATVALVKVGADEWDASGERAAS